MKGCGKGATFFLNFLSLFLNFAPCWVFKLSFILHYGINFDFLLYNFFIILHQLSPKSKINRANISPTSILLIRRMDTIGPMKNASREVLSLYLHQAMSYSDTSPCCNRSPVVMPTLCNAELSPPECRCCCAPYCRVPERTPSR